ncbi:MAG: type I-E CRISPR-associated protein Cas7/Cse4/CasC, partial [Polyangiaceae bacterium]
LATLVGDNLAALAPAQAPAPAQSITEAAAKAKPAKSKKQEKSEAKDDVPVEVRKRVEELLRDGSRTPELGLFGRMIADAPAWNVDAACQVAHAISTHRVSMEFDFYTAIDDLKREDATGSDMMGTIPFNSACFYRYLVVGLDDLTRNLGGDAAAREQAKKTLAALLRAAVLAIPSGKQNSMAAHNPPSFILTDVRDGGAPRSLSNAFVDPVRPTRGDHADLLSQSVLRLGKQLKALDDVYSAEGRKDLSFCVVDPDKSLASGFSDAAAHATERESLAELVKAATDAAFPGLA